MAHNKKGGFEINQIRLLTANNQAIRKIIVSQQPLSWPYFSFPCSLN
jgi:hypothetical protein